MSRWSVLVALTAGLVLSPAGPASADEAGLVKRWLLIGPFKDADPGKLLEAPAVGDPAALAPSAGDAAGELKWVEWTTPTGVVDFRDPRVPVKSERNCVVVGCVYVHSPKMRPAKLLLGYQYGASVFLNGRRVYLAKSGGRLTPDEFRTDVLLGAGWNRLLLSCARGTAFRWGHGFSARLTDPDLQPLAGLKLSTTNPFPNGKPVMPTYEPFVSAYTVEHFGTHRIRLVNRTPIDLAKVELVVRGRSGKALMTKGVGTLKGDSHVEVDVDVDEVFYQQHFGGAAAEVGFTGGKVRAALQPLRLEGAHQIEVETPHINRMKPWATGRPVILLLTRGRTRQAIELVQRGDFEWHWVDTADKQAGRKLREELSLYKFDCVVAAAQPWKKVPGFPLLDKAVTAGLSVVCVNPTELSATMTEALGAEAPDRLGRPGKSGGLTEVAGGHPILRGVPLAALPAIAPYAFKATSAKTAATVGDVPVVMTTDKAGRRTALLNLGYRAQLIWPTRREDTCGGRLPTWERQWSLVLKAVLWAAGKQAPATVSVSAPASIGREKLADARVAARATNAPADGTLRVAFRSRGHVGETTQLAVNAQAGESQHKLSVPAGLEAGQCEVDVTLLAADGKVLDWASAVFTVTPRGSIGKIAVAPAKDYYLPGDALTVTVPGKAGVGGLVLIGRLVDNRGRVVFEQRRKLGAGDFEETFSVKPEGLLTPVARFQAVLAAATHLEARAEHVFFVRQELVWDSYEPVLWLTRHGANWYYDIEYFRFLREGMWIPNGWNAQFSPRSSAYNQMVHGGFNSVGQESLHFFSMNHNWTKVTFELRRRNFNKTKDIRWLYRTPISKTTKKPIDQPDYANLRFNNDPHNSFFPLDDPGYLEWTTRKIAWQIDRVKMFNPIIYDLMDEGSYTSYARAFDFDYSPVSLGLFRKWLKGRYGSLAALNKEWETDFPTWDEVMPMHVHQVRARAKGKKVPNYAPLVDHRQYGDIVYNRYIKHCSDAARAGGDPDACVGIGGGQRANPYGGWDYWLVANHFTWIENYFEETDEYIRSFALPGRPLKMCSGKDIWKAMSHGGCGFYRWVDYGHLRGDFSLLPRGEVTARQLAEVRGRGFGKLILGAEPVDDPVGIHYSQSTIQLSYARGGPGSADQLGNGGPLKAKLGFYNLIEELGRQYKFVAYAQVEAGELLSKGYKLMVLPESEAISDQEAAELKRFVEAGGVLLCDRKVGEYNDHGRKRPVSVLKAAFGVDPAKGAEKPLGKGRVVYLASDFPVKYWRDRNTAPVDTYWRRMGDVLAQAGLAEARARMLRDGKPARRTEIRYFQLGRIRYHVCRAEVPGRYTFASSTPGHVYDMREARPGGAAGRIDVQARPSFPALVALSPYKIDAVTVRAGAATVKPGKPVSITATVKASAAPGVHAINFRVYGPDGKERRHYGRTLFGEKGTATLAIPTALNDARGKWTVKAADLASGAVGVATFEVN